MTAEFRRARRPLYLRLLLWFCIANLATLLVSVFATERIARGIYISEPDWPELAQQANAAYIAGGREALQDWTERERARGLDSRLYEDGRELLDRPPPPPARPPLPSLLDSAGIELRPEPELRIAGQRVTGRDGVVRQFVGVRGPKPPHARIEELLLVNSVEKLPSVLNRISRPDVLSRRRNQGVRRDDGTAIERPRALLLFLRSR